MDGLRTDRLLLRRRRPADRAPCAALNADPAVMEHVPAPLTRAESDALVDAIEAGFAVHGFVVRGAVSARPAGDFEHPRIAPGHPLRPHVLYRACRP